MKQEKIQAVPTDERDRDDAFAIIGTETLCALATAGKNGPLCSLMAYVPSEDCRTIYLFTDRDSRKFANIMEEGRVSLLFDTRNGEAAPDRVRAVTALGTCREVPDGPHKDRVRLSFANSHPQLKTFSEAGGTVCIQVDITSTLLLRNAKHAVFLKNSDKSQKYA